MDLAFTILGGLGAVLCILMYFLLERGYAKSSDIWYYSFNGLGAVLVLIAALYNFDGGDLGAVTQELCWAMISCIGIFKLIRQDKNQ